MRLISHLILALALGGPHLAVAQEAAAEAPAERFVRLSTSQGDIYLELFPDKAPRSVENFLAYVKNDFYDGTIFHRVISNFMIQGGGFTTNLQRKPTRDPIVNEADNLLANERGTIAMARTADPHSGTSQFFINVVDNPALNHTGKTHSRAWGYAVFGRVVQGMDVVDAIRNIPTGPAGPFRSDVPTEAVVIQDAEVVESLPVPEADENEPAAETEPTTAEDSAEES